MTDNETTAIVAIETKPILTLGSLTVSGPEQVVERASGIATALAKVINERSLFKAISGRKYVYVEGWTTLGAMLGVTPREVSCIRLEDGTYEAIVELVRFNDQAVIGRGSAICGMDESTWANRPNYARRSMAITRATGKAFRLAFSWIMNLAGYEVTPAEEMPDESDRPAKKQSKGKQDAVDGEEVKHWTVTQDWKAFWKYAKGTGLTEAEVHTACKVESMKEFKGSKNDAVDLIEDAAAVKRIDAQKNRPPSTFIWDEVTIARFWEYAQQTGFSVKQTLELFDAAEASEIYLKATPAQAFDVLDAYNEPDEDEQTELPAA